MSRGPGQTSGTTSTTRAETIRQRLADDILRGAFKAHEYGGVILPFGVLRLYK